MVVANEFHGKISEVFAANFNNTYLDQTDVIPQNIAQPADQRGYTAGIAAGYKHLVSQHNFLGGEVAASMNGHSATFQSGAATTAFSDTVQINSNVDLTFVPGIMLNDTISTYLKLGVSLASLQDNLTSPAGYTPTITSYNSHINAIGFAASLGVSKDLTEHTKLFTEASYHDYGTVTFTGFQNFSANYSHSAHVYSYGVVIGAAYTF